MYRSLACLFLACAFIHGADAQPQAAFPLWDGHESVAEYAKQAGLEPTKTIDLGNGVNLEVVLIPAGKFTMGTPEPKPVDEEGFRKKIIVGQAVFGVGVGVLFVLIGTVIIRAIRQRHRPQYSLARFMAMTVVAGVAVMGGMHWWFSTKALAQARSEYVAASARYKSSFDEEKPAHQVTITAPFHLGKFEVTQEQYQQVMGTNWSDFKGTSLPVEVVSWNDAQEFCKKASENSGLSVQLPTEAQWEYACRAGTTTTFYAGDTEADLGRAAWYVTNSSGQTHPVGQKEPNAWGLHDMHGNVWEWCQHHWQDYKPEAVVDPQGRSEGLLLLCVLRGGSWRSIAGYCRSACRYRDDPVNRRNDVGFRIVVVVAPRTP